MTAEPPADDDHGSEPRPVASPPARSLANLEGFLRVIRIPRADVVAMVEQAPPETEALLAAAHHGDGPLAEPADLTAIVEGVRRLYAPTAQHPELAAIRDGRAGLLEEAIANHRDGRHASAVALVITQIDGIAADVPPTPGAAFPFLVAAERDRDTPDPLITAERIAGHPGCRAEVAALMRTGRPDTNDGPGLHRHGIMHGRDLAYGTRAGAETVFSILHALVGWAEPLARERAGRTAGRRPSLGA